MLLRKTQIHAPKSLQSQSTVNLHKINKQWTPQHQQKSKSYLLKQILVLKIQKSVCQAMFWPLINSQTEDTGLQTMVSDQ